MMAGFEELAGLGEAWILLPELQPMRNVPKPWNRAHSWSRLLRYVRGFPNNDSKHFLADEIEINGFTASGLARDRGSRISLTTALQRKHRLRAKRDRSPAQARDADLGLSGAQYFYEARYLNANDVNTYNNLASRKATFTWTGSSWSVATTGLGRVGRPAINRWGDMRSTAQPQTEGDIIVGVQNHGLGRRYVALRYAVYNHTSDRQMRQFSVPVPIRDDVQNIGFHDIDQDGTND